MDRYFARSRFFSLSDRRHPEHPLHSGGGRRRQALRIRLFANRRMGTRTNRCGEKAASACPSVDMNSFRPHKRKGAPRRTLVRSQRYVSSLIYPASSMLDVRVSGCRLGVLIINDVRRRRDMLPAPPGRSVVCRPGRVRKSCRFPVRSRSRRRSMLRRRIVPPAAS